MKDTSGAAIVCPHVGAAGQPILYAARDEPIEAADSGWQFLCWSGVEEDESAAQVWSIAEVMAFDPSVASVLDRPVGSRLHRSNRSAPWEPLVEGALND